MDWRLTSEQDRRIRKVIKSHYAGEITAEECRRKLEAIFNEPMLEEFWKSG